MGRRDVVRNLEFSHTRYRLCIAASDVDELVASAGGWMYDRIQAGWDVSVTIAEPRDLRPLQILGATTVVTEHGFESLNNRGGTAAIAFASEAFDHNELLRGEVLKALEQAGTEVTIWGATIPNQLEGRIHRLQHRLSLAARAFKAHAVAAAPIPDADISATEDLYSSAPWYGASADGYDTHRLAAGEREDR